MYNNLKRTGTLSCHLLLPPNMAAQPSTTQTHIDSNLHHTITGDHKPHSSIPSPSPPPPHHLASLDRDSAVALGVLLLLILASIVWITHIRTKRRRAYDRDRQDQHLPHTPRSGSLQRIFHFDRKGSRRPSDAWPGSPRSAHGGEQHRDCVATLPTCEPRRASRMMGALSQVERDRRWWGSVAAHGSTVQADHEEQEHHPPLPPSPTLSSLSYDNNAFRSSYRSLSRAEAYTNPRECSIVGRDWMPFPRSHVQGLERPERIEGFTGVAWESGGCGLESDEGARRNSVTVQTGKSPSIAQD
jgi:hypothetical protein